MSQTCARLDRLPASSYWPVDNQATAYADLRSAPGHARGANRAEHAGAYMEAMRQWRNLFGSEFPAHNRPAMVKRGPLLAVNVDGRRTGRLLPDRVSASTT